MCDCIDVDGMCFFAEIVSKILLSFSKFSLSIFLSVCVCVCVCVCVRVCGCSQTFQVRIIDDEEYEKHENFYIVLEEPRWLKRGISGAYRQSVD